jgi:hypothetical protein
VTKESIRIRLVTAELFEDFHGRNATTQSQDSLTELSANGLDLLSFSRPTSSKAGLDLLFIFEANIFESRKSIA